MLPEFNRSERRALRLATLLVLLGAAARLGLGPGEASWAWEPADPGETPPGALGEVRKAVERSTRRAARIATPLAADERIDPNRASDVELQRLPGIGPARARAVVAHRRAAPFRWTGDLLSVRGIGPATLERLKPHLDLPDAPPADPAAGEPAPALDLNRAGPEELEELPGVGPVLAGRILEHRRRRGPFRRVEELLEVPGIGPARLDDLRPLVRVR